MNPYKNILLMVPIGLALVCGSVMGEAIPLPQKCNKEDACTPKAKYKQCAIKIDENEKKVTFDCSGTTLKMNDITAKRFISWKGVGNQCKVTNFKCVVDSDNGGYCNLTTGPGGECMQFTSCCKDVVKNTVAGYPPVETCPGNAQTAPFDGTQIVPEGVDCPNCLDNRAVCMIYMDS